MIVIGVDVNKHLLLQGRRALLDAPQDWRELVDLTTALKLTFVPPGCPSVDQRPDCVTGLGRVA